MPRLRVQANAALVVFFLLPGAKRPHARHHVVEVHLVAVELRAVDADELRLAPDGDATAAAHARAVDHDRVQGHGDGNAEGLRGGHAELHHDGRSDGDHLVGHGVSVLALAELLQRIGHQALAPVGAVVRDDDDLVRDGPHLILEDDQVLGPGPDDGDDLVARLLVGLHDRMHGRNADAAAHADNRPYLLDVGGASERPKEDGDLVAHLKLRQLERRRPHRLEHDGDPALLRVGVRDGQGHPLSQVPIDLEDDKLPRLSVSCDLRRRHLEVVDALPPLKVMRELPFFQNRMQITFPLAIVK